MVVAIVFLGVVGGIINNLIKYRQHKGERKDDYFSEAEELRDQILSLQERIQVLERIVTDSSSREDLRRQFRDLER
jgi:hypothetical protein